MFNFADETVTNGNSTKIENIGMTTGNNGQPVAAQNTPLTEAGIGTTGAGKGKPRSTLMSALKLAGQCVTAGVGGAGNNTIPSGGECYLTAKMGNKANVAIKGTQVQLSRTADGVWSCKIKPEQNAVTNKGWKDKFIPSGCSKTTTGNAWL